MKRLSGSVVLGVVVFMFVLLLLLPTPVQNSVKTASVTGGALLIENVYVTNRNGERATASILVRGGYIQRIGGSIGASADTPVIDATGLTAIPGLIDSHTHTYGTALTDALRFGITTSIDMFSSPSGLAATRAARDSAEPATEADLFSAGMLATAAGGHGTQFGIPIDTLAVPDEAQAFVRARIKEGSDFIKLVYMPNQTSLPSIDRATAKAVIEAAHAEGMIAVAHISTQRAALDMVEDGIDGLVHVFANEPVSEDFLKQAFAANVFVVPTLAVIESISGRSGAADSSDIKRWISPMQKQSLATEFPEVGEGFDIDTALQNVNKMHAAGIKILAGSDAPNPGTAHGISLHREMALLVEAGLSPSEAVRAATEVPTKLFGLGERGLLAENHRADMLLVQGNPYQNIGASRQIKYVIKNGYSIERQEFVLESAPAISSNVLGTFDQDLSGPDNLAWDATVDAVAGGSSTATVRRVTRAGRGYALAVTAEVKPGFAYPWAGAGLGSSNPGTAIDVSDYTQIVFDVKGTPGTYRFMLFSGMGVGAPPTREFEVSSQWQTVSLPLAEFPGFDPKAFSMLGIVAGPAPKSVDFVVDEVRFER